jgi:hypothetical protein
MRILSVKVKGVEHQLKNAIEFTEDISYSKGKQMFVLENDEFKLLTLCRDKELGKEALQEELNMIIDSYLFEPDYALSKDAIEFRERIRRRIYG